MSEPHRTAEEILVDLVAFNTVSALSNLELIEYVETYLVGFGVGSVRIASDDGTKSNLYATIGPADRAGVVLSGHTDVVPVANQPWDTDPFELTRRVVDGELRLYGRGSADMKGFAAAVLAMVPEFIEAELQTPIHIAFSYDEEIGCLGVGRMIDKMCGDLVQPQLVIIGEPTSMQIVTAHKGIQGFRTEITGVAAHSSAPHLGVNAIAYAAEIIQFLFALAAEKQAQGDPDNGFHPPWTTFNVGQIQGGEALNIIPEHCAFSWEFRPVPDEDSAAIKARFDSFVAEQIEPRLRAENPSATIETRPLAAVPPLRRDENSPAERLTRHLTGANTTHTAAYVAEASQFQANGIPAVLCGPGNIDQAHQANEWIALDQLNQCTDFLHRLLDWAKTGGPVP
ncbi:MAG: acetylornithine deacetylase [Alphaproteobacteria bacterium]|nr:acetylornithine deacetylase [Alphaproteobacteria bacterium]